jgi:FAD/FMN-containing dehydrogenase
MNKLIKEIQDVVGPKGILLGDDVLARPVTWPPAEGCQAIAIVRPANTEEVAAVMRLCHRVGQTVVTHGGLTGLVGGAIAASDDIVVSLERMTGMGEVDSVGRTLLVEAGVPLQKVHEIAEAAGFLFPLDLGARGSCTIGGNIATNAGGNSVIRYGMMRDQVMGVEAVMADGTIISSLNTVLKNNTGYDLKQLFVGSEGTLGIITRAVLRLRSNPRSCNTALVAIENFEQVGRFLGDIDAALGGTLSAFEVLWDSFYELVVTGSDDHGQPLDSGYPFYVLLESTGGHPESDKLRFEGALENALEEGLIVDAVIAQSNQQRADLWAIRDDIENLTHKMSPSILFDISLSIPLLDEYVQNVTAQLKKRWSYARMISFGHVGDGNIHLVICVGSKSPLDVHAVEEIVYQALGELGGVISAEHGIGLEKREFLKHSRSPEEINMMKTLKAALDPKNILNPGKIFENPESTS